MLSLTDMNPTARACFARGFGVEIIPAPDVSELIDGSGATRVETYSRNAVVPLADRGGLEQGKQYHDQ